MNWVAAAEEFGLPALAVTAIIAGASWGVAKRIRANRAADKQAQAVADRTQVTPVDVPRGP